MGIGDWAQSPIPNPQSPIPNPQFNLKYNTYIIYINYINNLNKIFYFLFIYMIEKYIIILYYFNHYFGYYNHNFLQFHFFLAFYLYFHNNI